MRSILRSDFLEPKIIYSEIVTHPQFYLDNHERFFVEATGFILTGKHLDYLIHLLNSKIIAYIFKRFYAGGGLGEQGFRYKKAFLENLPIPKYNNKYDNYLKKGGNVEEQVARLYNFTQEEIDHIKKEI